ncbi:MAG: TIGR03790 family protein [Opitutales bacterium]|nr:TIGR03790 family protein [Opitutales bacterium]
MRLLREIFFAAVLCAAASSNGAEAQNVFVAANKNSAKSANLAKEYCAMRGIPPENIIMLDAPKTADISRQGYDLKIARPIFAFLKSRGKIKDIFGADDPKKSMVVKSDVDCLVLCKDVPFRIAEENPDPEKKPNASTNNSACVDSELALLLKGSYNLQGAQKNTLFGVGRQKGEYKKQNFLAVSRLDGASFEDALNIAKSAKIAEEKGLRGRAYIDMSQKYPAGDKWLEGAKEILERMGFDLSSDSRPQLMNYFCRFDCPAFYFGWYTNIPRYYQADCRYADGASTLHIYSFSAITLTRKTDWTPSFAAQNSAAAFGYINEPFLHATHRPDVYMHYIERGFDAAEAAFYAMPAFSWKGIFLADAMYCPMKKTLEGQIADIESGNADEYSQYSIIRKMNLMLREGKSPEDAEAFAQKLLPYLPQKFALKWRMAQLLQNSEPERAVLLAKEAANEAKKDFQNLGLLFEIAAFFKGKNLEEESARLCLETINSTGNKDFLQNTIPALLKTEKFSEEEKSGLQKLLPPPKK